MSSIEKNYSGASSFGSYSTGEADPKRLSERTEDAPGSFLDVYRSMDTEDVAENTCTCSKGCEICKKAMGSRGAGMRGGRGMRSGSAPVMTEEEFLESQDDDITAYHPGAARFITPDEPDKGKDWHKSIPLLDLIEGVNLIKSSLCNTYTPHALETRFMGEVLNKSASYLTPLERHKFNHWKKEELKKSVTTLESWLNRKYG